MTAHEYFQVIGTCFRKMSCFEIVNDVIVSLEYEFYLLLSSFSGQNPSYKEKMYRDIVPNHVLKVPSNLTPNNIPATITYVNSIIFQQDVLIILSQLVQNSVALQFKQIVILSPSRGSSHAAS